MPGIYLKDEDGEETLDFHCYAKDANFDGKWWSLTSVLGDIILSCTQDGDKYHFTLKKHGKAHSNFARFNSCEIYRDDMEVIFPFINEFSGNYRIDGSIDKSFWVEREKGKFPINFRFSSAMPEATPSTPLDPLPTLADLIMERLYKDVATQDVLFVMGEEPFEAGSEISAPENEETLEEIPVDHDAKGSASQDEVANEQESENKDKKDDSRLSDNNEDSKEGEGSDGKPVSDEVLHGGANSSKEQSQEKSKDGQASDDGLDGSKDEKEKEQEKKQEKAEKEEEDPVQERIVGAHRMVLLHWPFFKKMIDSKRDDSNGVSELRIYISNVEWAAFRVLIRFLYTGRIPLLFEPKLVFADGPSEGRETSWEEVFLAADRCEIDELRELALTAILSKLSLEGTIPFLFRTAYLHEDLRAPVVKFVARTCGNEISKKSVQKEYEDHDECIELFGEIITALHAFASALAKKGKK